jgi:tripartite-type tricarboxylate transporter receptor subunit TctC
MIKNLFLIGLLIAGLLSRGEPALSQDQFYRGKLLRIIVGFPPGGGYDTYARLLARHLGKHIPGNRPSPSTI